VHYVPALPEDLACNDVASVNSFMHNFMHDYTVYSDLIFLFNGLHFRLLQDHDGI